MPDHVLIGGHVGAPARPFLHIVRRELPVLRRRIDPLEKPLLLLLLRDVQKELANQDAAPEQVALEGVDVLEPLRPDARGHDGGRKPLDVQQPRVDPHDEDLFVVGAVEDADAPALGQAAGRPPEEIVREVFGRRRLEREHLAALRVHARHHVFDRAVFSRRVHGLEDEQQRPRALCV